MIDIHKYLSIFLPIHLASVLLDSVGGIVSHISVVHGQFLQPLQAQLEALGAQRAGLEDAMKEMKQKVFLEYLNKN